MNAEKKNKIYLKKMVLKQFTDNRVGNHVVFVIIHYTNCCFLPINNLPFLSLLAIIISDLCTLFYLDHLI